MKLHLGAKSSMQNANVLKCFAFNYLFTDEESICPKRLKDLVRDIETKQWQYWKLTQDFMTALTFNQ